MSKLPPIKEELLEEFEECPEYINKLLYELRDVQAQAAQAPLLEQQLLQAEQEYNELQKERQHKIAQALLTKRRNQHLIGVLHEKEKDLGSLENFNYCSSKQVDQSHKLNQTDSSLDEVLQKSLAECEEYKSNILRLLEENQEMERKF